MGEGEKEKGQYLCLYVMGIGLVVAEEPVSSGCIHFVNTALFPDSPWHPPSGRCVGGADCITCVPEAP